MRKRSISPQPWKPKDLEYEDFVDGLRDDEPTMEYFIADEDLFLEDWRANEEQR